MSGRFGIGLGAAALAWVVVSLLAESGRLGGWPRYLDVVPAVGVLAVATHWLWGRGWLRLAAATALVAAGLLLGVTAAGAAGFVGLLFLPSGILVSLGAHDLWARARAASPPAHGPNR